MSKNFYQVIGVSETASADEIKKAYRKLAKKYHPDVTGGDKGKEAKFKEITEAYEVVGDEKKRAAYDQQRKNPFSGGFPGGGPRPGGNVNVEFGDLNDLFAQFGKKRGAGSAGGFSDIFGDMFGGTGREAQSRGQDLSTTIDIDLPEAALGAEKVFTIEGRRLTVKIPAGITHGKTIRLAGQGRPSARGGQAGDLLIEVHERPHARFRRKGAADIEVDVPVPVDIAILGGKADVQTLEGTKVTLTVPAASSSGTQLRLRGKGAVTTGGGRGDLYAVVSVQVPQDVTGKAKELLEEFAKLIKR